MSVYDHDAGDFEDRMTAEELATWARSLDGSVDEHGYLVLDPRPPLAIEEWGVGFVSTLSRHLDLRFADG